MFEPVAPDWFRMKEFSTGIFCNLKCYRKKGYIILWFGSQSHFVIFFFAHRFL